jgi:hypothetical protein
MSNINVVAATALSAAPGGAYLLEIFKGMEAQMEVMQSSGQFSQVQFVSDPNLMKPGDLIPELHFSLRSYDGPLLVDSKMEIEEGDG